MASPECSYRVVGYISKEIERADRFTGRVGTVVSRLPIVGISREFEPNLAWVPKERGDTRVFEKFEGGEAKVGKTGVEEVPIPLTGDVTVELVDKSI